ncbi:ABC transporter permease [Alginatibacterium sediminis]|uniref:ABC transporter permease n=1 Tax=Alginatibacterium sediminis TaxID=2164068 RepID=A0A420E6I5_9ALTE|nr:ABC transporter permease [Alginatibacterium sediminis]RKF13277.1 ABC transporter permease [Alginatibacterium sediminis]
MRLIKLAFLSLWNRKLSAFLTMLSIALSVTLLLGVETIRVQTKQSFTNTISGTDLIVGARSGSTQLLLYSVFHMGNANNNISWNSYEALRDNSKTKWSIPISLGDSHRGFRVVGTDNNFFEFFRYGNKQALEFAQGGPLSQLYSVTIGAQVARELGYSIGDQVVVAHGLGDVSFSRHQQHPFTIDGILKPTATPVDRSVIVSLAAIEAIHLPYQETYSPEQLKSSNITAALVGTQSRMQVFELQRELNQYSQEPLLAILPGIALHELWTMMDSVEQALFAISICVVFTGLLSMITVILAGLRERRREMAILRSLGARAHSIFLLLVSESLILAIGSTLIAVGFLYLGLFALQPILLSKLGFYLSIEALSLVQWKMLALFIAASMAAGILPALHAYRLSLSDGMMIKT